MPAPRLSWQRECRIVCMVTANWYLLFTIVHAGDAIWPTWFARFPITNCKRLRCLKWETNPEIVSSVGYPSFIYIVNCIIRRGRRTCLKHTLKVKYKHIHNWEQVKLFLIVGALGNMHAYMYVGYGGIQLRPHFIFFPQCQISWEIEKSKPYSQALILLWP